ncbi:S-layer homology domain-containing protein [Evansella sp. AB-rgal1]|uniref:S-layer homology domain-containing protein n=1 Tax=Evansella sp. AB-rgal1 TaxID=3242696 RepID=UPI00359CE091
MRNSRSLNLFFVFIILFSLFPSWVFVPGSAKAIRGDTYHPVQWPMENEFIPYGYSDGSFIMDPGGDVNPIDVDITSGVNRGIGNLPSVYVSTKEVAGEEHVIFRMRLKGDPYDRKGGFLSSVWLVQLWEGDIHKATVGLNGKSPSTDYVYVANGDGTELKRIYETSSEKEDGKTVVPGARSISDENGHYYLDFQVPLHSINEVLDKAEEITGDTPLQLFFGTSKAANLSVINKEWLSKNAGAVGKVSDYKQIRFNNLIQDLRPHVPSSTPTITIDGGSSQTYTSNDINVSGTTSLVSGEVKIEINGREAKVAVSENRWSMNLSNLIVNETGTYMLKASVTENDQTVSSVKEIVVEKTGGTDFLTITGGAIYVTSDGKAKIEGTLRTNRNGANYKIRIEIIDASGNEIIVQDAKDHRTSTWGYSPNIPLPVGKNHITVKLLDNQDNEKATMTQERTILSSDGQSVERPILVRIGEITDVGSATPSFKGSSSGAEQVEIKIGEVINNIATNVRTVEIVEPHNEQGDWEVESLENPLGAGNHFVIAIAKNSKGGLVQDSKIISVTETSITIDNNETGEFITNDTKPTIRGNTNAQDGSIVDVIFTKAKDKVLEKSAEVENGKWMIEVEDEEELTGSTYYVTATVNKDKLNEATAIQQLTIITGTNVSIVSPDDAAIVNETSLVMKGTSDEFATIDLYINGTNDTENSFRYLSSVKADEGGDWDYIVSALSSGHYTVKTEAADLYGNEAVDQVSFQVTLPGSGTIESVKDLTASVPYGTPVEEVVFALGGLATVTTEEEDTALVPVVWGNESTPVFDSETPGEYKFTGTLVDLPSGFNNDKGISVNGIVTVLNELSEFDAMVTKVGAKVAGDPFTIGIVNARKSDGIALTGSFLVKITSNEQGVIFEEVVSFADGQSTVDVTLTKAAEHTLTVELEGIFPTKQVGATVIAGSPASVELSLNPKLVSISDYEDRDFTVLAEIVVKDLYENVLPTNLVTGNYNLSAPDRANEGTDYGFDKASGLLTIKQGSQNAAGEYEVTFTHGEVTNLLDTDSVNVAGLLTLPQVSQPTWSEGDTIEWIDIDNAKKYEVILYKDGSPIEEPIEVAPGVQEYDFSSKILESPGIYTVTVRALGDGKPYTNGPVSEFSLGNKKTAPLDKVSQPTWSGDTIEWIDIDNAKKYEVILYKDGSPIEEPIEVVPGEQQYDFSSNIQDLGPGTYTVTVRALGDGMPYTNGPVSEQSEGNKKTAPLDKVSQPTWSRDVIEWDAVDNATKYQVRLYRDGSPVKGTYDLDPERTSYDFGSDISILGPGTYTVTVQALGDGMPYTDGDKSVFSPKNIVLEPSRVDAITVSGKNQVQIPLAGEHDLTELYDVTVKDQYGQVMTNQDVTWSLVGSPTGVTINASSGLLTVSANADQITIILKATANGISDTFDVDLLKRRTNEHLVDETLEGLEIGFESDRDTWESVTSSVFLIRTDDTETNVSWSSSNNIVVNIPSHQENDRNVEAEINRLETDTPVIVTATVSLGDVEKTRTFLLIVKSNKITKQKDPTVQRNVVLQNVDGTSNNISVERINIVDIDSNEITAKIDKIIINEAATIATPDNVATIRLMEDPSNRAEEFAIEINRAAVKNIAGNRNVDLKVQNDYAVVNIDSEILSTMSSNNLDLFFRIVPIKDATQQQQVNTRVPARYDNLNVVSIGNSVKVETNYSGFKTKLLVPFESNNIDVSRVNLNNLLVYVEHTTGPSAMYEGNIIYSNGQAIGLEIEIERFSTFTIVELKDDPIVIPMPTPTPEPTISLPTAYVDKGKNEVVLEFNQQIGSFLDQGFTIKNKKKQLTIKEISKVNGNKLIIKVEEPFIPGYDVIVDYKKDIGGSNRLLELLKEFPVENADFHSAYIKGFPDGEFKPEHTLTRAQLAAMLARNLGYEGPESALTSPYPDVKASHWASGVIKFVQDLELMKGYPSGDFGPGDEVTRAQITAIAARYKKLTSNTIAGHENPFNDVAGHWALKEIIATKDQNIIEGYNDGSFRPDQSVTRAEAVKVVNRMFDRGPLHGVTVPSFPDVNYLHWAFKEVEEAAKDHYFKLDENDVEYVVYR